MASGNTDYDPGILGVVTPKSLGCQFLLSGQHIIKAGWLRKKSMRNRLQLKYINWPQVYVVIADKCLYYFKNELSKKPSGAVSLYGYNRIVRFKGHQHDPEWAFKIEHIQPDIHSFYFSTSSEKDIVIWMTAIKDEMLVANNKKTRSSSGLRSSRFASDGISVTSGESWGSEDFKDVEEGIYETIADHVRPISTFEDVNPSDSDDDQDDSDLQQGETMSRALFSYPVSNLPKKDPNISQSPGTPGIVADLERRLQGARFNKTNEPSRRPNQDITGSTAPVKKDFRDALEKKLLNQDKKLEKKMSTEGFNLNRSSEASVSKKVEDDAYWSSVYFKGGKEAASEAISSVEESGVYIVRGSDDGSNVLMVTLGAGANSKKYKIFEQDN